MSILAPTERELRRQEERRAILERKQLYESRKAENLTPDRAFKLICKRIEWLNQKIDANREAGKGFELFIQEREALIWMMDKVKEMSEKLLEVEEEKQREREDLAKFDPEYYIENGAWPRD